MIKGEVIITCEKINSKITKLKNKDKTIIANPVCSRALNNLVRYMFLVSARRRSKFSPLAVVVLPCSGSSQLVTTRACVP